MKRRTVLSALLVLSVILAGILAGCGQGVLVGSGDLVTRDLDFRDFTKLDVSHAFRVSVTQAAGFAVTVTLDDNLEKYLRVTKTGSTLNIGLDRPIPRLGPVTLEAVVTLPALAGIDLSGASRGTVTGFASGSGLTLDTSGASTIELADVAAETTDIEASGASRITGDLKAGDVRVKASGASTVQLEGSGDELDADASGASRLKLAGFSVADASVSLSGASSGTVNASGTLDVDLSGASRLKYLGRPTMGRVDISGGSTFGSD
jgi:hypothetical protein